jgi:uncharacterized membrane protein YeaQ/YmgE (transglycosylase-associated protein family)
MIGMSFFAFLTLLIISIVVSIILFLVKVRVTGGFIGMVVVAWFGAWLGSPVLGYWWEALHVEGVYIVPAILGSLVAVYLYASKGKFVEQFLTKLAKKE